METLLCLETRFESESFIEKPDPASTKSRWALPGRYVFSNKIMSILKEAKPTLNGEIQLTDSMNILCHNEAVFAKTFTAKRFDAGDKLGYLQANIELALNRPELHSEFSKYLIELAQSLKAKFVNEIHLLLELEKFCSFW
jgi:UTP--glucose-1-phosphate uridylyltransferase